MFYSYVLASFQSDRHVLLYWLVECTTIWVWSQLSEKCNFPHLVTGSQLRHLNMRRHLLWTFCSTSFTLCRYALALWSNMAAALRAFRVEYYLWRPDWPKLARVIGSPEPLLAKCWMRPETGTRKALDSCLRPTYKYTTCEGWIRTLWVLLLLSFWIQY